MNTQQSCAVVAKTVYTLEGEKPAKGKELFTPLKKIDNALLLMDHGTLVYVGKAKNLHTLPKNCPVYDLGEVTLIPGVINCHTHLDLSFLKGATTFAAGFVPWLKSLIPKLPRNDFAKEPIVTSATEAIQSMAAAGTRFVGDIAGSVEGVLKDLSEQAQKASLGLTSFCEWLGYDHDLSSPWPARVAKEISAQTFLLSSCQPSAHALYSTSPQILKHVKRACDVSNRVFCLHLAESREETELLTKGCGSLFDLYSGVILPESWRAPKLSPLSYAHSLRLLGPKTLAIHGTQLDSQEAHILALSQTSLCLCPRSNANIGVGEADVPAFIQAELLLCLGTDGLTSNTDLNVVHEAIALRERFGLAREALIRMLTVNGAYALGLAPSFGRLEVGGPASFTQLPKELD